MTLTGAELDAEPLRVPAVKRSYLFGIQSNEYLERALRLFRSSIVGDIEVGNHHRFPFLRISSEPGSEVGVCADAKAVALETSVAEIISFIGYALPDANLFEPQMQLRVLAEKQDGVSRKFASVS